MSSKYLVCVGLTESHDGAIRFICEQIMQHRDKSIEIELFTAAPKEKNMQFFMVDAENSDSDLIRQKVLTIEENIRSKIPSSNFSISSEIYEGDFADGLKEKLLNDKSISLIVIGASQKSLGKGRTINNLIEKVSDMMTVPFIVIPQNITDEQISRILI